MKERITILQDQKKQIEDNPQFLKLLISIEELQRSKNIIQNSSGFDNINSLTKAFVISKEIISRKAATEINIQKISQLNPWIETMVMLSRR
jgi:hypothetical protein